MSVGLSIQFLTGRYHATPWDHQVNEGVVEWPPSPWRILRALVSAYYRLPEQPDRTLMGQLLNQLANQPPDYALPDYTAAHTRHYMPVWKEGKATTTKVFDTFYALPGGAMSSEAEIQVVWSGVELSEAEQQLLQQLCCQVGYLGRAESWVEMQVVSNSKPCNAKPLRDEETNPTIERLRVLAPLTVEGLQGFQAALAVLPQPKKGKAKWKAPADILEALELDIANLHGQNWNGIPGTRWIAYKLEPNRRNFLRSQPSLPEPPTFARFALSSNVLPKLTEAISLGERFRQALMSWSKDAEGQSDPVFVGRKPNESGEDGKGKPAEGHQHAWYLPEVNSKGRISHVTVYAPGGFQERAISALRQIPKVWGTEGFDVQTVLVSLERTEHYHFEREQLGCSLLLGKSCRWQSLTPMVLPRHPKCNHRGQPKYIAGTAFQIDGPEHQTLRLLRQLFNHLNRELSLDQCIEVQYPGDDVGDWLGYGRENGKWLVRARCLSEEAGKQFSGYRWQAFQRRRYHGDGRKESDRGYWMEIEFAEPKAGPIALGYAAHFGLGVFVPVFGRTDREV
ncbi:type I-U CRISPR-associated protein Csb2 [Leptolyngbya sp. FACHB-711]|uniref:type I-G CRISPR-associated protein Csb2 n=1 Tax=Leptolyngbya sp. FACHB-711 TaxID=2692813 RepID=UPI001685DC30|nr:type I-U CRISPR-associated protein Csb2 [Leptolyngbya sp. FACHB-711]MBD2027074.1 type I-U CRISPR-associated protein Cas5/Cas6 [Leptolyngbya sp. FACHB-711]